MVRDCEETWWQAPPSIPLAIPILFEVPSFPPLFSQFVPRYPIELVYLARWVGLWCQRWAGLPCLVLTASCSAMFWLCCYWHHLQGPSLCVSNPNQNFVFVIRRPRRQKSCTFRVQTSDALTTRLAEQQLCNIDNNPTFSQNSFFCCAVSQWEDPGKITAKWNGSPCPTLQPPLMHIWAVPIGHHYILTCQSGTSGSANLSR